MFRAHGLGCLGCLGLWFSLVFRVFRCLGLMVQFGV